MKEYLASLIFFLSLLNPFLPSSFALTVEEACQSDFVQIDNGSCKCKATAKKFDPIAEQSELLICEYATRLKGLCGGTSSFLKYVFPDRCYCVNTREYLTEPVQVHLGHGGRLFPYDDYSLNKNEEKIIFWDSLLTSIQSKIEVCKKQSLALNHYGVPSHQAGQESSLYAPLFEGKPTDNELQAIFKDLPEHIKDPSPGAKTIKIIDEIPGRFGGKYYLVARRTGTSEWVDASDYPNPQGDPRLNIDLLGPTLADFFGFKFVDKDRIQIPDVQEINLSIQKLNDGRKAYLKRTDTQQKLRMDARFDPGAIEVHFYDPKDEKITNRSYLNRVLQEGALPVGPLDLKSDQTIFLHDVNFHTVSWMMLPNWLLNAAFLEIRYLNDLEKYFKSLHLNFYSDPSIKIFLNRAFEGKVHSIDFGSTAAINTAYERKRGAPLLTVERRTQLAVNSLLECGLPHRHMYDNDMISSPKSYIESIADASTFLLSDIHKQNKFRNVVNEFIALKTYYKDFSAPFESSVKTIKPSNTFIQAKFSNQGPKTSIVQEIDRKREFFEAVVRSNLD